MRDAGTAGPRRRPPGQPRRSPGPLARAIATVVVRAAGLVTDLLGASPTAGRERITEAELRDLVAANTLLDPMERRIIDEVLGAGASLVREVMMPRTDVVFLAAHLTLHEAAQVARAETHTRYPVVDGTHDDVVGFVHLRDLLIRPEGDQRATVRELTREVKRLPGSKRVLAALSEMRRERQHLAVVVDEYGGTAGIVTLEDLIEELVGEIHDEYDAVPEPTPAGIPAEVDGRLNLADFAERVGFALPAGPYETVGGFVMAALGRLPVTGDEVLVPGRTQGANGRPGAGGEAGLDAVEPPQWLLRVSALDGRRVARVEIATGATAAPVPRPAADSVPGPVRASGARRASGGPAAARPPAGRPAVPRSAAGGRGVPPTRPVPDEKTAGPAGPVTSRLRG